MIILITGASHTGKTLLAQKLLEKYNYPYLSIDHLKMGMIRSGNTQLTPVSADTELTMFLWPIVREIIKTVIENRQNLIIEGCYIPFDWKKDFTDEYRKDIRGYCLAMSENYIRMHFDDIKQFANVVPFPVSWTVKMKKKQKETQDILSYHTQAAGCSDKARAKASGGRQPIEECGRTGL